MNHELPSHARGGPSQVEHLNLLPDGKVQLESVADEVRHVASAFQSLDRFRVVLLNSQQVECQRKYGGHSMLRGSGRNEF